MPDTILMTEGHDLRRRALRENLKQAFLRYRLAGAVSGEDLFSWPRADSACLAIMVIDFPPQWPRRDPGPPNPGAGPQMVTLSVYKKASGYIVIDSWGNNHHSPHSPYSFSTIAPQLIIRL
jgi:hypothetical protein